MKLWSRWFGTSYDDERLVSVVQNALVEDPLIVDSASLMVSSEKGVITLGGVTHRDGEKDRMEGVMRSALKNVGLKYDHIVNELTMSANSPS